MSMKCGAATKDKSLLVAVWIPRPLLAAIDRAVEREDTDRSKFIRRAVRNHVSSLGLFSTVESP